MQGVEGAEHDYTKEDLVAAFRSVGLEKGDVVFSHVGMSKLGHPKEVSEGLTKFDVIFGAMMEVIGQEGTLLAPVYTYSFCEGEVFDPLETPSKVGYFGEALRKTKGAKRSLEPIFSVAGIGPKVDELFADLPHNCFGHGSILERLEKVNAKQCNIGVSLHFTSGSHYLEQMAKVPYRYLKVLPGYVKRGGELAKESWIYNVRVRGDFSYPNYERVEEDVLALGLCRRVHVGKGQINCIAFRDLYDFSRGKIAEDPWYFARKVDLIEHENQRVGIIEYEIDLPSRATMKQIIQRICAIPRDIVSDGYNAALKGLSAQVPMSIYEYPTGTECFGWIVPEKWTCHEARLETADGEHIFSYADHPLHVVSYSQPFEGEISRAELLDHLHVHPNLNEAIPYVQGHNDRVWGLCCSKRVKDSLQNDRYKVQIKADFSYSTLKVGEIVVNGESEESFILCANLCHCSVDNDCLAGVAAGLEIVQKLLKRSRLRYTYRFLIFPDAIGAAAYLSCERNLIHKMRAGLFLAGLGASGPHCLHLSSGGNTLIDRYVKLIVGTNSQAGRVNGFAESVSNIASVFNRSDVGVPMLALSRIPPSDSDELNMCFGSLDNYDFRNIAHSCDLVLEIVDAMEKDRAFERAL